LTWRGKCTGSKKKNKTKQQQQQQQQARKTQTDKNKAMRTLKTCGPKDRLPSTAAYKPWAYTTL